MSGSTPPLKAKELVLHEKADIALIEVEVEVEMEAGLVGPICLPSGEEEVETGLVAGWGTFRPDQTRTLSTCFTDGAGPERFRECRRRFVYRGDLVMVDHRTGCSNLSPPSLLK